MKIYYLVSIFVFAIILTTFIFSCSSSFTEMTGTWTKPGFVSQGYKNILVIAVAKDQNNRLFVENAFVKELKNSGLNASASWLFIPSDSIDINKESVLDDQEKEIFKNRIKGKGFDGALVLSLRDIKSSEYFVPGYIDFTPPQYYGYFYNYYFGMYPLVVYPSKTVTEYSVYMESNFYDLGKEELLWVGQSRTLYPKDIEDFSKGYSKKIVSTLFQGKVLK